jgi:flavin reductase (DIM6/NTAB) family NADH-FMN oxidoreductase RutF
MPRLGAMEHVQLDPAALPGRQGRFLLTALVVPRPIAWVSTLSPEGVRNLAPHSYFNIVSSEPPIVHFTSSLTANGEKDSLRNARATGEFVVNLVSRDLVEQMNTTAADFPPEEDEFSWAGLDATPSVKVAPPRVAAARAALECRVHDMIVVGNGHMVFGEVVHVHVAAEVWRDGRVDPVRLAAVARLGGSAYTQVTETFSIPRPTWQELRDG